VCVGGLRGNILEMVCVYEVCGMRGVCGVCVVGVGWGVWGGECVYVGCVCGERVQCVCGCVVCMCMCMCVYVYVVCRCVGVWRVCGACVCARTVSLRTFIQFSCVLLLN
jgi:hypothetical protein